MRSYTQSRSTLMSEDDARALFYSIPKRGRGKRGQGRNPNPHPSKEAERKWRAREPQIEIDVVRALTEADLERLDRYYLGRMNGVGQ